MTDNGQDAITSILPPDMTPRVAGGVPYCSENGCPLYDGKRCMAMGFMPSAVCEPAVAIMGQALQRKPVAWGLMTLEGEVILSGVEREDIEGCADTAACEQVVPLYMRAAPVTTP